MAGILEGLASPLIDALAEIQAKALVDEEAELLGNTDPGNIKEKIDEAKESIKDGIGEHVEEAMENLGSDLSLLADGTKDFALRLASIPMAIIGMGTTGPTVSVNLILPLLQQLQGEARNLSNVYKKVESSVKGFMLDKIPEVEGIYTLIQLLMSTAAIACSIVGVSCGDREAKEVNVESPMKVEASECSNYQADSEHANTETYPPEVKYCLGFEGIMTKTIDDFEDDESGTAQEKLDAWNQDNRVCSNCKNYKKR